MEDYDHKQYTEWMNSQKEEDEVESRLLVEAKLSKYWKQRARRRAKDTKRVWPNKIDREWAISQQEKSTGMNQTIQALFEKELEASEGIASDVDEMMKKIKDQREQMKLKREAVKMMKPQDKVKIKKNLSVPLKPQHGGVKKGFDKNRKKIKAPAVAPDESWPDGGNT